MKKPKRPSQKSQLEAAFLNLWQIHAPCHLRLPMREWWFANRRKRKWRLDFAWPHAQVAVEIEGGIWTGGGHNRGAGYRTDLAKYNCAAIMGWSILRYVTNDLRERPLQVIEEVATHVEKNTRRLAADS